MGSEGRGHVPRSGGRPARQLVAATQAQLEGQVVGWVDEAEVPVIHGSFWGTTVAEREKNNATSSEVPRTLFSGFSKFVMDIFGLGKMFHARHKHFT